MKKVKKLSFLPLIFIYVITFIYCFVLDLYIRKKYPKSKLSKMMASCIIRMRDGWNVPIVRGNNYTIGDDKSTDELKSCFVTSANLSHLLMYVVIGFLYPHLFWLTFFIGLLNEAFELVVYDCSDMLDILMNASGFFIGKYIRLGLMVRK